MKLESRSNSPMDIRLLMGSLHHCIFVSFKLLKSYKNIFYVILIDWDAGLDSVTEIEGMMYLL